jgi:hypothetical protein
MPSAPFVISLDGECYTDASGQASDLELAGGAKAVLGAGRWVVDSGRMLAITNESPTYHPTFEQMQKTVAHLGQIGADLSGDGTGVLVVIYESVNPDGKGERGTRYRAVQVDDTLTLIPEQSTK